VSNDDEIPGGVRTSIPITWGSGRRVDPKTGKEEFKHRIDSQASLIKEPSLKDIAAFADQTARTCGSCVHYHPPEKNKPTIRGFLARAVHEAGWKTSFMPGKPEELTRCAEDSDRVVGAHSKSCDHYREAKGRIR